MALIRSKLKAFVYPSASPEETALRRILMGAILEFGEPHNFESGTMTRPVLEIKEGDRKKGGGRMFAPEPHTGAALEYYMLQEDGQGFAIFGALRTTYVKDTPAEPVRFAVQFVTVKGTAVIDVAVPSRYEVNNPDRERSYDEKLGPHVRVGILSRIKGARLENILLEFMTNKLAPIEDFKSLFTLMRELGETKAPVPLKAAALKLLTECIAEHFGDFSARAPEVETTEAELIEIIPETPAEVPESDGWVRGVARAAEEARHPEQE